MIAFKDSIGVERHIEFSRSFNKSYVNLTIYTPTKSVTGNTLQIPCSAFKALIGFMQELQQEVEQDNA